MAKRSCRVYSRWANMHKRCYDPLTQRNRPTYSDCEVHADWFHFPNFKAWAVEQIGHDIPKWSLDKDLLVPGNRVYGPDTCVFVPNDLNCIFNPGVSVLTDLPKGVSRLSNGHYRVRVTSFGDKVYDKCHKSLEDAMAAYEKSKRIVVKARVEKWREDIDPRLYERLMKLCTEGTDE